MHLAFTDSAISTKSAATVFLGRPANNATWSLLRSHASLLDSSGTTRRQWPQQRTLQVSRKVVTALTESKEIMALL
jgi:hypothetical protein